MEFFDSQNFVPKNPTAEGWVRCDGPGTFEGVKVRPNDAVFVTNSAQRIYFKKPDGPYEVPNELASVAVTNCAGVSTTETIPIFDNGTLGIGSFIKYPTTMRAPFDSSMFLHFDSFNALAIVNVLNYNTDCGAGKFDSFAVDYTSPPPRPWYYFDFSHTLTQPAGTEFDKATTALNIDIKNLFGFQSDTSLQNALPHIEKLVQIPKEFFESLAIAIVKGLSPILDSTQKENYKINAENQVKIWLYRQKNLASWFNEALAKRE